jgi:pimeloyl-ACP methyl ester carboxylesterase
VTASLALVPTPSGGPAAEHPQFYRLEGDPDRLFYCFLPAHRRADATPLILVHGISRNAAELVCRFAGAARRHGVPLIAPLFPAASYGMYQQARDRKRGADADRALLDILDFGGRRFSLDVERCDIFGFSGGAQFAHRFALLHPRRIRSCVAVSAGWYTMPDAEVRWPYGLANAPDGGIDREAVRQIPFHVVVGRRDTMDDAALRKSRRLDRQQGENRLSRARSWARAMSEWGANPAGSLTILPRTRHNFASAHRRGLIPLTFELLGYPAATSGEEQ